jgi:excisionase family DNA binding protein
MDRPAPLAAGFVERRAQAGPPRRRWDDAPPATPVPAAQVALTVKQVAALLGMTPKAVYHRAERGQLPGKFYVGKSLRFRRADLLRSIAEGRGLSPTRSR